MPAETILSLIYIFLSCFIESFYFVWCKVIRSCQECLGEGAVIAVSARWTVSPAKAGVWISVGWCLVRYSDVISSSEYGSIRWIPVYGMRPLRTILSCLWQFDRCPPWFVHQREQKRFGIVLIPRTGICWENRKRKSCDMLKCFSDSKSNSLICLKFSIFSVLYCVDYNAFIRLSRVAPKSKDI